MAGSWDRAPRAARDGACASPGEPPPPSRYTASVRSKSRCLRSRDRGSGGTWTSPSQPKRAPCSTPRACATAPSSASRRALASETTCAHDLRHTCATLLLSEGVNAKVASEMLGHSSITITLNTYSHVLPDMQDTAADAMESALDATS